MSRCTRKRVEWNRRQAAASLALPRRAPLNDEQRYRLRTLGVSVFMLGAILQDQGNAECLRPYQESLELDQRIGDKAAQAVDEFNLGHAYKDVPGIRDLAAAEAAYQRSLDLRDPNDVLGRSKCIKQIGMVHHERFRDARQRNEPVETLLRHAQAAQKQYLEVLRLYPKDALTDLAPLHNQLGNLYSDVGQLDNAREHFEQAAQYFEKAGNRLHAGQTRFNMALMYVRAAGSENQLSQQRASVLRAQAYAGAALRDYQHYQGRAAKDEAKAQGLLDRIDQALAKLPQ